MPEGVPLRGGAEPHLVLVARRAHVDDLAEGQPDRAVFDREVVPLAACHGAQQAVERVVLETHAEGLGAVGEADRHTLKGHGCASAGWTSSVSSPPAVAGCRKATRELRMPVRGVSSMSRRPEAFS